MSLIDKPAGTRRVVIDQITPSIDGGRHPFKRVVGDLVAFAAHAFADSHDLIQVVLRIRKVDTKAWKVFPMAKLGNDEFEVTYRSDSIGLFEFEVAGVIDHYGSWQEAVMNSGGLPGGPSGGAWAKGGDWGSGSTAIAAIDAWMKAPPKVAACRPFDWKP